MEKPSRDEIVSRIEQKYEFSGDVLKGADGLSLKAFMRHAPKKGQPKRYLAFTADGEEGEVFEYLSGLWSIQGTRNEYEFELNGSKYILALTGLGKAEVKAYQPEPALTFKGGR